MVPENRVVFVTGAAGWIGRQVCSLLQERGAIVTAFDLRAAEGPWEQSLVGDLDCFGDPPEELRCALSTSSAVIHCAGRAHRPVETAAEVEAFNRTNVVGTEKLLHACKTNGVERVVYVSTIAGYDWTTAAEGGLSEDGAIAPGTGYARSKLKAEGRVRESMLDWRVARLATVFGEGDRANFAALAGAMKRGRFVVPGAGAARKSVIPVDLAAEVLVRLALVDEPRHRLMNVALAPAPTLRDICEGFSQVCGFRRAPALPVAALRGGAMVGSVVSKWWPEWPLTVNTLNKLVTSTVVDNRRMRETFPNLRTPNFAEALRPAANFYRNI